MTSGSGEPRTVADRFLVLESWRGICAMAVVLFHFGGLSHIYEFPLIRNGDLGVKFFFVLSGFVMMHAYGGRLTGAVGVRQFIIRRIGRLYPLHLATLLAMVLLELVKLGLAAGLGIQSGEPPFEGTNSLPALVANVALLNGLGLFEEPTWNGPSWTISTEIATYLIFLFVCLLGGWWTKVVSLALIPLAFAGVVFIDAGVAGGKGIFICVFGFFLGVQVYILYRILRDHGVVLSASLEWIALLGIFAVFWAMPQVGTILSSLVFGFAILVFAFQRGPVSRVLLSPAPLFLGVISYSVYLVHFPILTALNGAFRALQSILGLNFYGLDYLGRARLVGLGPWSMDLLLVVYLALVVATSVLTYRWVEEPGRRYFNRLSERGEQAPTAA